MIRVMLGGLCHAHGPFKASLRNCPHWPNCVEIPANPFFKEAEEWFTKYPELLEKTKNKVIAEAYNFIERDCKHKEPLGDALEELTVIQTKNSEYNRLAGWDDELHNQ
jgi:hypothetical protein